jgi:TrmH family RNA methyltransferase
MVTISSPGNERIKGVRRLRRAKERLATGRTLLEGPHVLQAALGAGIVPELVFVAEGDPRPDIATEVIPVTEAVLGAIAPTDSPRGPIAVIEIPNPDPLRAEPTLVLWDVATPGNVGTLIRSAAAFGWNVARHGGADPWSPKVLRAAAGGHFAVPISQVDGIGELEQAGLVPVATVPDGGVEPGLMKTSGPVALLVGNEANGLPVEVIGSVDLALTIPMAGSESLNAAVAGAIAMYELSRESRVQSRESGP